MNIYPRPQLARATWIDLRGPWGFAYDDMNAGLDEGWQERRDIFTRSIQVPFPPESPASGIHEPGFHPVVWYRRIVQIPSEFRGKRLLLHCGAIDYRAQVWVNGQLVATHEGGQTPFSADITNALSSNGDQVLVIRAEDPPLDMAQPRGKQDWQEQPHSIWYHRTTGIWQPVWLEPISSTHITSIRWTPDRDRNELHVVLKVSQSQPEASENPLNLRIKLTLHGNVLADDIYQLEGTELQRAIAVNQNGTISKEDLLWSPSHPNLIDAELTLHDGDTVLDKVQSYAGFRSVGIASGRFLLNGSPYYLRLALEQGYWPQSHLAAPSDEALRREVELAKELGFNGVRIHQKVEDPRFLYWCDRLGLLVWGEMANTYVYSPEAVTRLVREWLDVLERDHSHPCIVTWVPLNESWGIPNAARDASQRHYAQALYHLTKALDPTRPVIENDGWEHVSTDILSIHDYAFEGATLRVRYGNADALRQTFLDVQPGYHQILLNGKQHHDEPVMLTEFGGVSYEPNGADNWHGYGTVADRAAFLAKYRELVDAILDSPVVAGFCYTQLTDTGQETNGLLTENREPKLDLARVREITARASNAVPGEIVTQKQQAASKKQ
jgi:beta-galactosidase/beta-glucuronidase